MAYVVRRRRGTARRGTQCLVDRAGLVSFLARRCEGCSLEEHVDVARRFFAAQPGKFNDEVQAEVIQRLAQQARRIRARVQEPAFEQADGSTICSRCHERFYDHEPDTEYPWLNKLCDGRKVKLW